MTNHIASDALYMTQVWKTIKEHGYEFLVENGDPDGVDFVARRIVEEVARQSEKRVGGRRCKKCGLLETEHHNRLCGEFVPADANQRG